MWLWKIKKCEYCSKVGLALKVSANSSARSSRMRWTGRVESVDEKYCVQKSMGIIVESVRQGEAFQPSLIKYTFTYSFSGLVKTNNKTCFYRSCKKIKENMCKLAAELCMYCISKFKAVYILWVTDYLLKLRDIQRNFRYYTHCHEQILGNVCHIL